MPHKFRLPRGFCLGEDKGCAALSYRLIVCHQALKGHILVELFNDRGTEGQMPRSRKIREGGFFLIYKKNQLTKNRFMFAFAKNTGNAVRRNRFKRWARHFLRTKKAPFSMDLIMGFEKKEKSFYERMNYEKFSAGFEKLWTKIQ